MFEPIGPDAQATAIELMDLSADDDTVDFEVGIELLETLDASTLTPCGVPGAAAFCVVISSSARATYCGVAGAGTEAERDPLDCGATATFPDSFPCFADHPLGGYHVVDDAVVGGWEVVDCDTAETVVWDVVVGDWVPA